MRLRDRDWRTKYDSDAASLVDDFYLPAMRAAVRYDRSTGYYSASLLKVAARGVEHLVENGGRMRLVVGCTLGEEEVEAIRKGLELREAVAERVASWPLEPRDVGEQDAVELLAWMVAHGILDVRVAVPCGLDRRPVHALGIFHEKAGVVWDASGDALAFQGSVNETLQGWGSVPDGSNWESFSVYTSWGPAAIYVEEEAKSFERLWSDEARHARVVDVPTAVREDLLRFLPKNDAKPRRLLLEPASDETSPPNTLAPPIIVDEPPQPPANEVAKPLDDELRKRFWSAVRNAPLAEPGGERVGEATAAVEPWPHQVRAFQRLYRSWPPRLLIADEVGLGKTIQAGMLLRQAWLSGRARRILVMAPRSVLTQWQLELREKFNLSWPIYDGHELRWPASPGGSKTTRKVTAGVWPNEPIMLVSSHLVRRRARVTQLLEAADWDLVVLDEAHHARRKGAGGLGEEGPNRLLQLMQRLVPKTKGLVLLTATPMQVHPVELWDLLALLGLPKLWTPDLFERFFELVAQPAGAAADFELLARLFRAAELQFGRLPDDALKPWLGGSLLGSKNVLRALRDDAESPRRQLSAERRQAAFQAMRLASPVARLVSRHTRELLRRYIAAGKLDARIAQREVSDRFVEMTSAEREVYDDVERYIGSTWNNAAGAERNAIGFVMTIYRRRLASSFAALRETLMGRVRAIEGKSGQAWSVSSVSVDEDFDEEEDELDQDDTEALAKQALKREEKNDIAALLAALRTLPLDSKARVLLESIRDLREAGYRQVIVFTQYTDTLDFLRGVLAREGLRVACFSGRGGEVMTASKTWQLVGRDDLKRRFRAGEAEVLVATDAAAEGLNFQFCGALVNYDLPWNPMRVEQRIGRIDRLGQAFEVIRVVNLHYNDTVETDVYVALERRIGLFKQVVGKLQPILATIARRIADVAVGPRPADVGARRALVEDLETEIAQREKRGFDLDAITEEELGMPARPEPAMGLVDLETALATSGGALLPAGWSVKRYSPGEWELSRVGHERLRITTNPGLFEQHPSSYELWSAGSPVFPLENVGAEAVPKELVRDLLAELEAKPG